MPGPVSPWIERSRWPHRRADRRDDELRDIELEPLLDEQRGRAVGHRASRMVMPVLPLTADGAEQRHRATPSHCHARRHRATHHRRAAPNRRAARRDGSDARTRGSSHDRGTVGPRCCRVASLTVGPSRLPDVRPRPRWRTSVRRTGRLGGLLESPRGLLERALGTLSGLTPGLLDELAELTPSTVGDDAARPAGSRASPRRTPVRPPGRRSSRRAAHRP